MTVYVLNAAHSSTRRVGYKGAEMSGGANDMVRGEAAALYKPLC